MRRLIIQLMVVVVLIVGAAAAWYFLMPQEEGLRRIGGPSEGLPPPPVVVAEARLGPVAERVEAVGTARAREAVEVVAETAGRVSAIRFEEGERVAGGDVLVELDSASERAELLEALAQRSDVRKQLERARQLLARQHVPPAQVDELEAAVAAADARVAVMQSRLEERQIRAPFDGIVGLRDVSLGAYVGPGQRITTLDDLEVTLGQRREGEVEIRAGVGAGERIVVEGIQRAVDNASVRVLHTDAQGDVASPSAEPPREVSKEVAN